MLRHRPRRWPNIEQALAKRPGYHPVPGQISVLYFTIAAIGKYSFIGL